MEPWEPLDINMPSNNIRAAKRINLIRPDASGDWWVGHGKDETCMVEGKPNHWFWLAFILLGLVDSKDAPYSEEKPLPYSKYWLRRAVIACEGMDDPIAEIARLKAKAGE